MRGALASFLLPMLGTIEILVQYNLQDFILTMASVTFMYLRFPAIVGIDFTCIYIVPSYDGS